MTPTPTPTPARSIASSRVRWFGCAVVVIGWLAAAVVYIASPEQADPGAEGERIVGGQAFPTDGTSARELQQLERLGGKAAVLTFKFDRWFVSLWSGRPLAFTLAMLSLLVAAACVRVAGLMDETGTTRSTP